MTDQNTANVLEGYLSEAEMAHQRGKGLRTLRLERQRGDGPPYTRDGRDVLYPIDGFRAWLKAGERQAVRGRSVA
jgi:hypothetical protein